MYARLTRYRIRVQLVSPAYLGLRINEIFCHVYTFDAFAYTRGTRIAHLNGVRSYLNNYFAMYTRATLYRIRVDLESPAYLRLGII